MKSPIALMLAGVAAFAVYKLVRKEENLVTGKSGKSWRVVLLGKSGSGAAEVKTYELFSPAGSFGPHGELSVVRYSQTGSDMGSRKVVAVGQGVPAQMLSTAASDFGLPVGTGGALPLGSSA